MADQKTTTINNDPFARSVSLTLKSRLRNLKKQILAELGMDNMCNLRVFFYEQTEAPAASDDGGDGTEKKDEPETAKEQPVVACGDILVGDMSTLSEMGLRHGGKVEVELVFGINVSVAGKGQGYHTRIEVGPNEKLEVVRERVGFYKIFSARDY